MVRIGEKRGAYMGLLGKTEGRTPLGRPKLRWEDNIKSGLKEIGWEGVVAVIGHRKGTDRSCKQ